MLEQIKSTASFIQSKIKVKPRVGIVLGSGLGGLVDSMEVSLAIPYAQIPGFPVSTVEGHAGRLIFGRLASVEVVAMQGRFHYYEGYTPQQVVLPIRVLGMLGIEYLFLSNASGGINTTFKAGDLMVITDHINLIPNPLIGPNEPQLGTRFPDMSEPYDHSLIALADGVAQASGLNLQHGCYIGLTGPSYETQKEYGFYRTIGGDAVGMSTTPEVIAARHMQLPVFGLSVVTNMGLAGMKASHEEVQQEGIKAQHRMTQLVMGMLKEL